MELGQKLQRSDVADEELPPRTELGPGQVEDMGEVARGGEVLDDRVQDHDVKCSFEAADGVGCALLKLDVAAARWQLQDVAPNLIEGPLGHVEAGDIDAGLSEWKQDDARSAAHVKDCPRLGEEDAFDRLRAPAIHLLCRDPLVRERVSPSHKPPDAIALEVGCSVG